MRRIKILSRDIRVGDFIIGRCEYGNDKPAKTTEDGDQLAKCGHRAFFGMKLVKADWQRKKWQYMANFCGNMIVELNRIKGPIVGSLQDIAIIQTNLEKSAGDIKDKSNQTNG